MEFLVKIQATAVPLVEKMGTKYLLIFRLTTLLSDYTLRNKIRVSMLFYVTYKFREYYTVNNYLQVSNFITTGVMHFTYTNLKVGSLPTSSCIFF